MIAAFFPANRPGRLLLLILALYLALAIPHSLIAPLTSGNDEWAHFLYARFIAEHGRLPINLAERQNRAEAGTKADDPPLYHLLVAAAAAGEPPARLLRPVDGDPQRQLADNQVVSYAFLVHTGYENFPFPGELWVWAMGRALSILFGAGLIVLTYLTGLTLFARPTWALAAAGLLAFIPAFIFHTSVMTYDSLGALFTALFLLVAIQAIKQPDRWRWWSLLGLLAGLAVTTKYSSVLLPLEIVFVSGLAARCRTILAGGGWFGWLAQRVGVAGLAMLLATSWWFGFVIWHFNTIDTQGPVRGVLEPLLVRGGNDSTAISVTAFLLGEESVSVDLPAPARQRDYGYLAWQMVESFWSARIAERYLLSPWLAGLMLGAVLLSGLGLVRLWLGPRDLTGLTRTWLALLLVHTLLVVPLILIRVFVSFDPLEAVQGRHILFPAVSAIPLLLVWGWAQWSPKISPAVLAGLFLWSGLGQVGWAAQVYPGPLPLWQANHPPSEAAAFEPAGLALLPELQFLASRWRESDGGQALEISLWWQAQARMRQDYLVELSLVDGAGQVVSLSLAHPVQGRYPTRAWEVGDLVRDDHWLPLNGPLQGRYELHLRLLDRQAQPLADNQMVNLGPVELAVAEPASAPCATWFQGQPDQRGRLAQPYRLRANFTIISPTPPQLTAPSPEAAHPEIRPLVSVGDFHLFIVEPHWAEAYAWPAGGTACAPLRLDLRPRDFSPPQLAQPLAANFNDEILLLGYELPTRRIAAGGRLPLTLYWQALAYVGEDYQIFDNLLNSQQQRWGGYDRRAKDGYSTLLWAPGEVITDRFGVPVAPDAPDGVYTIDVGLYRKTEAGAVSLPLFVDGQPEPQSSIRLGPIKVGGPPAAVTTTNPTPQVAVQQTFGDQITLLGYDRAESASGLTLTFYWQAEAIPATDYTVFLHLRDGAEQNVAQMDQPPAQGQYPTSLWDPGEIIAGQITLPLTEGTLAAGEYVPVVGLYDFSSGVRLPLTGSAATELRLESVTLP